jgi:hypothetical protein
VHLGPRLSAAVVAALALTALALSFRMRFAVDDAFISFSYARSLVRGGGLTWFGDPVEGYTNFLWVLWIALGLLARVDPVKWAWLGSLASLLVTVFATYRLARLRDRRPFVALVAVAILVTNFTFLAYGTSGLETMLQAALVTTALVAVEALRRDDRSRRPFAYARVSLLLTLAVMTRLDSALLGAVLGIALIHGARPKGTRAWAALLAPAAASLGAWFFWKIRFYGSLFPNTLRAKLELGGAWLGHGLLHDARFLTAYGFLPWLVIGGAIALHRRSREVPLLPLSLVAVWLAYVALVGGDFMEFRFFVPILPPLVVALVQLVCTDPTGTRLPRPEVTAAILFVTLAVTSRVHATTFTGVSSDETLDSVDALGSFYGAVHDDWPRLGAALGRELAGTGATLACNGAGAIPYYSGLYTVDQLGLTDAWVARSGVRPGAGYLRPGHQRFAPLSYLRKRGVTFVLGTPFIARRGLLGKANARDLERDWPSLALGWAAEPVDDFTLVAIPVDERDAIVAWYLSPAEAVTERIRRERWETVTIHAN